MRLKLSRECFDGFYPDALPLLEKHKAEISTWDDIALDVDVERYREIETFGSLRIYTARLDRGAGDPLRLIGYAVFFVSPHMHYKGSIQAVADVVYVDPDQRRGRMGLELVQFCDRELRKEGVQVVYHHVKTAHPALGRLLEYEGYSHVEQFLAKRLDR